MQNHYETLGVVSDATPSEISEAAEALLQVFKHHSDGSSGAVMAARIREAQEVLSNPDSRREFDRQLGSSVKVGEPRPPADLPYEAAQHDEPSPEPSLELTASRKGKGSTAREFLLKHLWRWVRRHIRLTMSGLGVILVLLLVWGHSVEHPAAVTSPSPKPSAVATHAPAAVASPSPTPLPSIHPVDPTPEQLANVAAWVSKVSPNITYSDSTVATTGAVISVRTTAVPAQPFCLVTKLTTVTTWFAYPPTSTVDGTYSLLFSADGNISYAQRVNAGGYDEGCDAHIHFTTENAVKP